jgi:hypothetical protein
MPEHTKNGAMRQAAIAGLREVAVDLCTCGNAGRPTPHTYMCPTRRIIKWLDRLLDTLPSTRPAEGGGDRG